MDCDKSQYGGDCQSSTGEEKDDADAEGALCKLDPQACVADTSAGHLLELVAFGVGAALGPAAWAKACLALPKNCMTGLVLGAASFGGTIFGQLPHQRIDLLDALVAGAGGFVEGYVLPSTRLKAGLLYLLVGGTQSAMSDSLHGRSFNPNSFIFNSLVSGLAGVLAGAAPRPSPSRTIGSTTAEIYKASIGVPESVASIVTKRSVNDALITTPLLTPVNFLKSFISSFAPTLLQNLQISPTP